MASPAAPRQKPLAAPRQDAPAAPAQDAPAAPAQDAPAAPAQDAPAAPAQDAPAAPLLLEQAWAWDSARRGIPAGDARPPDPRFQERLAAAARACEQALADMRAAHPRLGAVEGGVSPSAWFRARGFEVVETLAPARFGPLMLRAVVDLDARGVEVYREAVVAVSAGLEERGVALPCPVSEVFLAHEAFHVLAPCCPPALAELAAHLFCTRACALPFFAGLLDRPGPPPTR